MSKKESEEGYSHVVLKIFHFAKHSNYKYVL